MQARPGPAVASAPLTAAASEPMAADPDVRFAFAMGLLVDGVGAALSRVSSS